MPDTTTATSALLAVRPSRKASCLETEKYVLSDAGQHFLLSALADTLLTVNVVAMKEENAWKWFIHACWVDTRGKPY